MYKPSELDSVFERIADANNLRLAFKSLWEKHHPLDGQQVRFQAGPDGETLESFAQGAKAGLLAIREDLLNDGFAFGPYFEKHVRKGRGEQRLIAQFNVRERIIFRSIYRTIAAQYDDRFSPSLVSYRKGLGTWDAVLKAVRNVRTGGNLWVFKSDVQKYAETFDHGTLRKLIRESFGEEKKVMNLLLAFLEQRRIVDGVPMPRAKGCPQGSELTTFFYNFYLKDLDTLMETKGFKYLRYGDDIIVWAKSKETALLARTTIAEFVGKMGLNLNPRKTYLAGPNDSYNYLGYRFRGSNLTISEHSLHHLTHWVRHKIKPSRYLRVDVRRLEKNEVLRAIINDFQSQTNVQRLIAWLRYFQLITDTTQIRVADRIIRERILACATGRFARGNYRLMSRYPLDELGLYSLVGLYYRMKHGRPLPLDIERKLGGQVLFAPGRL